MKKKAFSYIELVVAMAIMIVLMFVSAPLVTRKAVTPATAVFGEYRCYYIGTPAGTPYYLQARYNEDTMAPGEMVANCTFFRPQGATRYTVTLIGGGGGGAGTNSAALRAADITTLRNSIEITEKRQEQEGHNITNELLERLNSMLPAGKAISNDGARFLLDNNMVVTNYMISNLIDQFSSRFFQNGSAGQIRQIRDIPAGIMPFNNAGSLTINLSNNNAAPAGTGIYVARDSAVEGEGRMSSIVLGGAFQNPLCVSQNNRTTCTASGGGRGTISTLIANHPTTPENRGQVVIRSPRCDIIDDERARINDPLIENESECGANSRAVGSGGKGAEPIAQLNTPLRETTILTLNDDVGKVFETITNLVAPTRAATNFQQSGRASGGAGGGIIIEWSGDNN